MSPGGHSTTVSRSPTVPSVVDAIEPKMSRAMKESFHLHLLVRARLLPVSALLARRRSGCGARWTVLHRVGCPRVPWASRLP
jgi:hypothetical protein